MSQESNPSKPLSTADFYQVIHQQIDGEDQLMNQRVNWLILSQSLFFSAFTTLLSSPPESENSLYTDLHEILLWLIPGMSLIVSLFIYLGILTSLNYMSNLRQSFQDYPQDETIESFPPIQSTTKSRRLAQLPPIVVPLLFISTWVFLLVRELR